MRIFAISDLHLPGNEDKPMSKFGPEWEGHLEKIKTDWKKKVTDGDLVLICGDLSWSMNLAGAVSDFESLSDLPGKKIFCRGNHDFWWHGISKVRAAAPDDSFVFLQNDCAKFGNVVICGSRGWAVPGAPDYSDQDEKIYKREAERFRLCFEEVKKVREEGDRLIVMIHYPPFSLKSPDTLFTQLFSENKADKVLFGHIHGDAYFPFRTVKDGAEYLLTSCDKLNFSLKEILL